jgi:hypothetical protein
VLVSFIAAAGTLGGSQMNGAKSEGTGRDVVASSLLLGSLLDLACMDNRCGAVSAAAVTLSVWQPIAAKMHCRLPCNVQRPAQKGGACYLASGRSVYGRRNSVTSCCAMCLLGASLIVAD